MSVLSWLGLGKGKSPNHPKIVLVVDDEHDTVELVTLWLKEAGYQVLSAHDGVEALKVAREKQPDLMVLDLAMPRMHGYEVLKEIRADKAINATKVIVTSGKNYAVDIRMAKDNGADLFVSKPYQIKKLVETIKGLIGSP